MKTIRHKLAFLAYVLVSIIQLYAQGYLVANGVITNYAHKLLPGEISVVHDPFNYSYTGFALEPQSKSPPTSPFINTFRFDYIVDVGVRVFLVSPNDPITLQAISAHSYTELQGLNNYTFPVSSFFYLGLYTGNQNFHPPNGIYTDPLFGWAKLANVQGVVWLVDCAVTYKADGIFAGTQNIIQPIPEPGVLSLAFVGLLGLGWCLRRTTKR